MTASMYENPFTKRCTCSQFAEDYYCLVHNPFGPPWERLKDTPEKRAEFLEKMRSVQIGNVKHK